MAHLTNLYLSEFSLSSPQSTDRTVTLDYSLKAVGRLDLSFNMGVFVKKGTKRELLKKWGLPFSLFDQLRSGQTISQTFSLQLPNWGRGSYLISIHADVDDFLRESNENDNIKKKRLNLVQ